MAAYVPRRRDEIVGNLIPADVIVEAIGYRFGKRSGDLLQCPLIGSPR